MADLKDGLFDRFELTPEMVKGLQEVVRQSHWDYDDEGVGPAPAFTIRKAFLAIGLVLPDGVEDLD